MYGMIDVGECTFRSVSIEDKETGRSFKIDGIQDAVLEMPLWSADAELPISISGHIPTSATFECEFSGDWNKDLLNDVLFKPLIFEAQVNGLVQIRRHRKKRINKKWAKMYGYKVDKVSKGHWRFMDLNSRDGEFRFEKVYP